MFKPKYPRADRRVVRGVRAFLDSKPYRASNGAQITALETLGAKAAKAYRLPAFDITISSQSAAPGTLGWFDEHANTLVLPRCSLLATLYHVAVLRGSTDQEAKGYASSVVHLARPKTLRNFVRKGTCRWNVARNALPAQALAEPAEVTA